MAKKKKQSKKKFVPKKLLDDMVDERLEIAMKELPDRIDKAIQGAIFSILGISQSYGRPEIDHCNGRWNMFADCLKAEASKDVIKIIKRIKTKFNFDAFKEAFQKEYQSRFNYALKYEAERRAKELVDKLISQRLEELIPKKIEKRI